MKTIEIRAAAARDFEQICALNRAVALHTSTMDGPRLVELHALCCYHKVGMVDGSVAAFLLAMRSDAPYQNENFAWFERRYKRFIYVDRVVVSGNHRGLRLGSLLYEDLFQHARTEGISLVNLTPSHRTSPLGRSTPNSGSPSKAGGGWLTAPSRFRCRP